ncbi:flagellar hook-basal body protein [Gemmatirosa kalamazoonensis]|uniref:Flagellar hook protein FlgE n=1 Tax=Gemmatirosa kalamazoonensis TaxID=861299 RepID=W0RAC9_9BACT|nr:flagellar hook protein FlgE [Gemmatirosa kalamazoonensis]AHG87731.1 flagellar hook-basal body protein [Gemmatirosa kalamazoonensis]
MLRSLFAGVSGLRNHQVRMDVIGNNIANVNTVAFKAGRVTFKEGFAQLLQGASRPPGDQGGINPIQVGLGMQIGSIDQLFTQGNIETTGQTTDLALQGDSFFVVRKGNQSFYTRSGNFQLDADGRMVSPTNGFVVQGKVYQNGVLQDGIQDIKLPFGQKVAAKVTSTMKLAGNLSAAAPVFDTSDPDGAGPQQSGFNAGTRGEARNAGAFSETSISIFDSQGTKHDVKIQFYKTAANTWNWQIDPTASTVTSTQTVASGKVTLPRADANSVVARVVTASGTVVDPQYISGPDASGAVTIDPQSGVSDGDAVSVDYFIPPAATGNGINSGTLVFDTQGNLDPTQSDQINVQFGVLGADDVNVSVDYGSGTLGLTQYATSSTAVLRDQDGYTAGTLQNFSIDRYGTITGFFTNGTTSPLGKIVLADFNNPSGLLRTGDNMYQESANSGAGVLGFALEGSQSQITSGALEMSNVDLAQEFTNMIVAQRGFQANGKVVSSSDEMLQELLQIKR